MNMMIDASFGISGDMTVGMLLDLGADRARLQRELESLGLPDIKTEITSVKKKGLMACDFNVILPEETHDHDMDYLYGHLHGAAHEEHHHDHDHENDHEQEHEHHHDHEEHEQSHDQEGHDHHPGHAHDHTHHDENHEDNHGHDHHHHENDHHHGHVHRAYRDVKAILDGSGLSAPALTLSHKIFRILAEAESLAHGVPVEDVTFHEVGALDSIADICAISICFTDLAPEKVYLTDLTEGCGTVRTAHGILPVPVPAVAHILEASGLPVNLSDRKGEYITPTGAAFLAAVVTDHGRPGNVQIRKVGYGAGKRTYEVPGILTGMLLG